MITHHAAAPAPALTAAWIQRCPHAPYFQTAPGHPWHPIGQNDSLSWLELAPLLHRHDVPAVQAHLATLARSGVTCLRLMLEYAETGQHFFEQPAGRFNPVLVQFWDDLMDLLRAEGLRVLLTPFDTFFHYVRWDLHPYNTANGGPCPARHSLMVHPEIRDLAKARLAFATQRWGGDGTIFAWDLWNEMHPAQGENRPDCFDDYIGDIGPHLRTLEHRLHGRAHLQTVSVFGPELAWKPWLNTPIFRHPALDFANSHFYDETSIDDPTDTVAPAQATGRLVREALAEIHDGRPFFDTEHGPIHAFKDRHVTLPEPFDDEYFRHIQWAHLASGGAGGGMRWPNRNPHRLTPGMRQAQHTLARFLPLIDWTRFRRTPVDVDAGPHTTAFACADPAQAVLFLLRHGPLLPNGQLDPTPQPGLRLTLPTPGTATFYDPTHGHILGTTPAPHITTPPFGAALAIAVQ